ncbi:MULTISPECIES: cytochrome b [Chromobacteriaceae]|uniref:Cytochrome b n=2 Tax=Chromobacteriaceae TaxID=1499392 RepID=A0ABV0CG03_9NEIS|nr:cytochrome b [Pseudogulbenkiania ferrooxidans]ERE19146.1 cytochrome B561 [Pseudogulbenkiania ferrooxidans EGD-HP2]
MSQTRYTSTAILLHWLMAVMLVCLFGVGFYMHGLPFSPLKLKIYSWHKWAGVTVFLLVWLRLVWRFGHRPPALPSGMGKPMRAMAHAGHLMLYLLMAAIPLSGWLMSSAKGVQTVYFGVLPLPDLIAPDQALGENLQRLHGLLNYLLAAVVAGHVAAALKHHLIDRDDVLTRMLPWRIKS